jgi:hypothetical protein
MNDHMQNEGQMNPHQPDQSRQSYIPLARWLQELLAVPAPPEPPERTSLLETGGHSIEGYHPQFYRQIPDFAAALLANDSQATLHYAPLFYHLIGCSTCHSAYLEIYDAMRAALTMNGESTIVAPASQPLALAQPRMLVYLSQLQINQARAVLRQSRRDHIDRSAWARALLRQAITISTYIQQSSLRVRALQDLVEVAALALGTGDEDAAAHSYSSVVAPGVGVRKGGKIRRRAEMLDRPADEESIDLESGTLEGLLTQEGETLELRLHDLDESLRGRYLLISIPLGALLEPVRWLGRNPHAIRSQVPVDAQGNLRTPLGTTDLRLSNREDRNMLEAMFKKLDIRPL